MLGHARSWRPADLGLGAGARGPRRGRAPAALLAALLGVLAGQGAAAAAELAITQERGLAFGQILAPAGGRARVTMPSDRDDPLANPWSLDGSPTHRARFAVEGRPGAHFVIELPREVGGRGYVLSDFTSSPADLGQLDSRGRATIHVGATLRITPAAKREIDARFEVDVRYP